MALITNVIPVKDPLAVLPYAFDWSAWLQPSETIISAPLTVSAGITLAQGPTIAAGVVTFWLSGGVAYQTYLVACEIVTNQGRTDSRSFQLTCQTR